MNPGRIDVVAVRAAHPLPEVVTAAGVNLRPSGHGFMGCCPFHDDSTASLSVDGVPDRYHCFGCGASGDVIDFVERRHGLTFTQAVAYLDGQRSNEPALSGVPSTARRPVPTWPAPERAFEINSLAWAYVSRDIPHAIATSHLRRRRGLDLTALERQHGVAMVGHLETGWTAMADHLQTRGVSREELVALDLCRETRRGTLIDSLRDRLIVPVTNSDGRLAGLIGRDLSGDQRAPKYRNPTRTVVYDKARTCYQPVPARTDHTTVVLVEGPLDALAVAAAADASGRLAEFTPVSTGGVTPGPEHARHVAGLTCGPVVIAMDGDHAGRDGTRRWIDALGELGRCPLVAHLPPGRDPADWVAQHGPAALNVVDPVHLPAPVPDWVPGPAIA